MIEEEIVDNALCKLNEEYLKLKSSKEYQIGLKISKFIYAIRHLKINSLRIALEHRKIRKRLQKSHKSNDNFLTYDRSIVSNKKIVVYTCITGNYDNVLEPLYKPDNIDYYIITDMEINKGSLWRKIDINTFEQLEKYDNTRKARYVKTHPHIFFQEYEYSIWVDSNFRIIGDLSKYIKCIGKGVPFASNWHPFRNSIYTELDACIMRKKDNSAILKSQVKSYKEQGMPDNFGLIESNMIVRRHNDEKCRLLMEAWWNQIDKWSKRDQISLPYVIWTQGYTMKDLGFICTQIRDNPSVQVVLHSSAYKSQGLERNS